MPSSRVGYGYGAYSSEDFGVEGVLATSSALVSASVSATATVNRVQNASATASSSSANTISATRVRESDSLVSSTASTASVGEQFVLKLSTDYEYGLGG